MASGAVSALHQEARRQAMEREGKGKRGLGHIAVPLCEGSFGWCITEMPGRFESCLCPSCWRQMAAPQT
eukprot:1146208-Pelagomonas_calceolata.AAC.13